MLSLWLRKVIGKIISESQHASVGEFQILEASFMANEAVTEKWSLGLLFVT